MEKTKAFLEAHYKRYILTICLLWFLMFFLPWDWQIGGVSVYYFVMKKLFVVFGVLSILYSVLIKKISLLIFVTKLSNLAVIDFQGTLEKFIFDSLVRQTCKV